MDSAQETGVKTPDAEPRRSDRLTKGDTDAYTLPAPIQVKEREAAEKAAAKAAAKTAEKAAAKAAAKVTEKAAAKAAEKTATFSASTPQKTTTVTEEEAQLDLDIDMMEKSIQDEEQKLKDMVDQKRVQAKRTKLERLKQKLDQSQKKVKDAKEAGRPLSVTLISDSMAKYVENIPHVTVQSFPCVNITTLQHIIRKSKASINYKYTILLVGTNNIEDRSCTVDEIMSYYNDLVTTIRSRSSTKIIVSAIIPRPCDLKKDPYEKRVKDMNKELKLMCKRRNIQFLHTFRIFLHNNKPIRSYFAVNDKG